MPRSTSRACGHWLNPGRWEVQSEAMETSIEGLPPHPPQPWVPAPDGELFVAEFCDLSPIRACALHHQRTGCSLGHSAREGTTRFLGRAFRDRPALRHLA